VFIINACGYELRTQSEVLSNKLIDFIATDSELNLELERQLNLLNNNLEPKDSKYDLALQIREHKIEKFVGSIGSGARTTQVRLDYSIVYEVTKKNSKKFINQFNDSKFIDFNQSNILAFEKEIEITSENFIRRALKNMEFLLASQKYETQ
tara:strand:- start:509 stop:961 length:453 start_codon:yes stop_codon:yes gene_type:complete